MPSLIEALLLSLSLCFFFHFSWQQNRNRELKMLRSLAASVMSAKKHHEIKLRAKPEKKTGKQCKYFWIWTRRLFERKPYRYSKRIRFTSFPIGNSMVSTYEYISSNFRNKIKNRRQIMTATVYDGGLTIVYSARRSHSSKQICRMISCSEPFFTTPQMRSSHLTMTIPAQNIHHSTSTTASRQTMFP